ncbi:MAG: hypothetical protein ACLQU3_24265 [Limisphaerales bacterium]
MTDPRPQGRANGRQPLRSECIRVSAAAASRRQPSRLAASSRQIPIYFASLVFCLSLFGCGRSYRDAELVGSWQFVTSGIAYTYTFSADHTFTYSVVSSKDLRNFGDWTMHADQLAITLRTSSFSPIVVSNREMAQIIKLTDSVLILKDRDRNDVQRERTFRRLK